MLSKSGKKRNLLILSQVIKKMNECERLTKACMRPKLGSGWATRCSALLSKRRAGFARVRERDWGNGSPKANPTSAAPVGRASVATSKVKLLLMARFISPVNPWSYSNKDKRCRDSMGAILVQNFGKRNVALCCWRGRDG